MTGINIFDQDTLGHLQAQGVSSEALTRVRAVMQENARSYEQSEAMRAEISDLQERLEEALDPPVVWIMPLSYAEVLHTFLHRNMPGGYQEHHDNLLEAIGRARPTV